MLKGKFDNVLKWMQLAASCCVVIAALTSFGAFVFSSQFRGAVADAVLDREERTLADLSESPPPTGNGRIGPPRGGHLQRVWAQ